VNTLNVQQGTNEWLEARAKCYTASEAPAMLGVSNYKKRSDLLKEKATGIVPEVDEMTQRRFDNGHKAETAARPVVEAEIGEDLYPTTATIEIDGMTLLASFDGITILEDTVWENKLLNESLENILTNNLPLPEQYTAQLEQQLLVSGAGKAIFSASSIDGSVVLKTTYTSNPELRQKIIDSWKQFHADLENYIPEAPKVEVVGSAPDELPALRVEVSGMVKSSNLEEFKTTALSVFKGINKDLKTDEDFANAEKTVKWCKGVEDKLDQAKQNALSQTATIDDLFTAIDSIKETARQTRLELGKLVKSRKEQIKLDMVRNAGNKLADHCSQLNKRLGRDFMPYIDGAFAFAIKGKKTFTSMQDAIDTAMANAKTEANAMADKIEINLKYLDQSGDFEFLFPDLADVVTKENDDFDALIVKRINDHNQREDEKRRHEAEEAEKHAAMVRKPPEISREARASVDAIHERENNDVEMPSSISPERIINITKADLMVAVDRYLVEENLSPRTESTVKKHLLKFIESHIVGEG